MTLYNLRPYEPRCGDLIFVRFGNWMGRVAQFFTRHRGEAKSKCGHMGISRDNGRCLHMTLKTGPKLYTWLDYFSLMSKKNAQWLILRHEPEPSEEAVVSLQTEMDAALEIWSYSHIELGLQGVDNILEKIAGRRIVLFRRLGKLWRKGVVCSTGTLIIIQRAAADAPELTHWFPRGEQYFSPDDALDYTERDDQRDNWVVVARSKKWVKPSYELDLPLD